MSRPTVQILGVDSTETRVERSVFNRSNGLTLELTIFATPRTVVFFDILFVGDDEANFVSIDGQMERL